MTSQTIAGTAGPRSKRRIVLAQVAGFCFGVRRAVELTQAARRERFGKLTTLGPLVHNMQVVDRMRSDGIEIALTLDDISSGTVVMSAHGVPPETLQRAMAQGLDIVDVTCPFVTKVHRSAKMLFEQGYQVLLVGDPGHTEVKGVIGAVEAIGGSVALVTCPADVRALKLSKKVGVVSQTTQSAAEFAAVVAEVCTRANDVRAINTVCNATDELQEAAIELARQVDVVIVVGGRKSANTKRLRQLCEAQGVPAYHIETEEEIDFAWIEGKDAIGLTAGASTPDWMIERVARALNGGELPGDWSLHHPDE